MRDFTGPFDGLDDRKLHDHLSCWCAEKSDVSISKQLIEEYYNTISPRSIFFKSCRHRSTLLDVGAGNGALSIYKEWPNIARKDIELYGISLEPIERASAYKEVAISNFETGPLPFGEIKFDTVIACHFIEHLNDPMKFITWVSSTVRPGARVYLEWPHPFSMRMMQRSFFNERGIPAFTTNFMDDYTHVEAWSIEQIIHMCLDNGLVSEAAGRIVLPEIAALLRDIARNEHNIVAGTFAVWATVGWAQYLVLSKAF